MSAGTEKIRILLVDDSYLVRQSVKAMLDFDRDCFEIAGEAENGVQAVEMVARLRPDVVLMDVNMPDMDGITATTRIMEKHPVGVVIISVQGEQEYLRRAMKAGACDYLLKPFTYEELGTALRTAAAKGSRPMLTTAPAPVERKAKVITLFSTKGGVGKTTIAANLAAGLAQGGRHKVTAIDLDLEFGALTTMLGIDAQGSIIDLCRLALPITGEHLQRVLSRHQHAGVAVLSAPSMPHLAQEVDGDGKSDRDRSYVTEVLAAAESISDYVVIDTSVSFREANLIALDRADVVLMVTVPEVPALESTAKGLDVMLDRLEYPEDKVQLLLNRSDSGLGLEHDDIARSLGVPIRHVIPSDGRASVTAANTGVPVVLTRARTPLSDAYSQLAEAMSGKEGEDLPATPKRHLPKAAVGPMRRILGMF